MPPSSSSSRARTTPLCCRCFGGMAAADGVAIVTDGAWALAAVDGAVCVRNLPRRRTLERIPFPRRSSPPPLPPPPRCAGWSAGSRACTALRTEGGPRGASGCCSSPARRARRNVAPAARALRLAGFALTTLALAAMGLPRPHPLPPRRRAPGDRGGGDAHPRPHVEQRGAAEPLLPRCGTNFAALVIPRHHPARRVWIPPTALLTPVPPPALRPGPHHGGLARDPAAPASRGAGPARPRTRAPAPDDARARARRDRVALRAVAAVLERSRCLG